MLGSSSRNDLSTSSKDTSLMFTSNRPSAPGRKGKRTKQGKTVDRDAGGVQDTKKDGGDEGKIIQESRKENILMPGWETGQKQSNLGLHFPR